MRPPRSFFTRDWCSFVLLRFGFLMIKVPLPTYAALYRSSGTGFGRYTLGSFTDFFSLMSTYTF